MSGKVSGTFVQETPKPGRSWHRVDSERATVTRCGQPVVAGRFEFSTTDQMPDWKVCASCSDVLTICEDDDCPHIAFPHAH